MATADVTRSLPVVPITAHIAQLLVTGGTGFIGGAVLAAIYPTPLWSRTLILVRGRDDAEAKERILSSLARFLPNVDPDRVDEAQIVRGDLRDGAALANDQRLCRVSHVIHSAAVTSFSDHPRIRAINVDASLDFVKSLVKVANVERFLNVGTAWCVGLRADEVIEEAAEPHAPEHIVAYTGTKLDFEREVRRQLPDLPFVTARPSIVVGHTRFGTRPSGSIYWVFRAAHILRQFTCDSDDNVDVVPVDWVAGALIKLCAKEKLAHDTYHLSAGLTSYSKVRQLDSAITDGLSLSRPLVQHYCRIDEAQLLSAIMAKRDQLGDAKPKILSKALSLYGRFAQSGVLFDNTRMLAEGIAPPPPFHTYIGVCAETARHSSLADQMEDDFK